MIWLNEISLSSFMIIRTVNVSAYSLYQIPDSASRGSIHFSERVGWPWKKPCKVVFFFRIDIYMKLRKYKIFSFFDHYFACRQKNLIFCFWPFFKLRVKIFAKFSVLYNFGNHLGNLKNVFFIFSVFCFLFLFFCFLFSVFCFLFSKRVKIND